MAEPIHGMYKVLGTVTSWGLFLGKWLSLRLKCSQPKNK